MKRADAVGNRITIDGNDAAALGAVYGGATVAAWYPITPSTALAEAFTKHCRRFRVEPETGLNRYVIVQAEDEIAAIGMVIGAAWNGARAFTATSGPGISLMQEFFGLAYFAEVPAVIFDVQRGGPSTGLPTRTQQSDILITAYASHGDTRHVLLFPEDPQECFEFASLAFDLADRLQTPVFVMLDLDIGMNEWLCEPLAWDDRRRMDRGKVLRRKNSKRATISAAILMSTATASRCGPIRAPIRRKAPTSPAAPRMIATPATARSPRSMRRTCSACRASSKPQRHWFQSPSRGLAGRPTSRGAIYFGSTSAAMDEAVSTLEAKGIHLDLMRLRAFPFSEEVADFVLSHDQVFVIEQNRDAQMRALLTNECALDPARLIPVLHYSGVPITARFIVEEIARHCGVLAGEHQQKAAE